MPSYNVTAINIASFDLGESDKVLTLFTPERGVIRAVAKAAKKPGSRMSGRADLLNINQLQLASGKTFEIIAQAQTKETFPSLRLNLRLLATALLLAELTAAFGIELAADSSHFYQVLRAALKLLSESEIYAGWICLEFEFLLLDILGYRPELDCCVLCRSILNEDNLSRFASELGGAVCSGCYQESRIPRVAESYYEDGEPDAFVLRRSLHLGSLVWKGLILARDARILRHAAEITGKAEDERAVLLELGKRYKQFSTKELKINVRQAVDFATRALKSHLEIRAGKRFKSFDLLNNMPEPSDR